ncbi:Uncharacterized protein FWK35_00027550, partial [Aphis craccivora]
ITSRNNAPISNFGGGFRWKSEYPWCITELKKKIEKNKKKKKMTEKREFSRKTSFRPNQFFYNMVVTKKLITVNTLNFHQLQLNVKITILNNISRRCLKILPLRVENLIPTSP